MTARRWRGTVPYHRPRMVYGPIFKIKEDYVYDPRHVCGVCRRKGHYVTAETVDWSAEDGWDGTADLSPADWGEPYRGVWHKRLWAQ